MPYMVYCISGWPEKYIFGINHIITWKIIKRVNKPNTTRIREKRWVLMSFVGLGTGYQEKSLTYKNQWMKLIVAMMMKPAQLVNPGNMENN